jgi:predicted GH43/DUF377 family glycosyl hydrolase
MARLHRDSGDSEPIGVIFNDTAISGAPVNETQQVRVAVLCSVLGRALEPCHARIFEPGTRENKAQHPLVREAARVLLADPSLSYFFALARSRDGINGWCFDPEPILAPETADPDTNIYDMRLTAHEDGWIYGLC